MQSPLQILFTRMMQMRKKNEGLPVSTSNTFFVLKKAKAPDGHNLYFKYFYTCNAYAYKK
jgi:hypothetical protein